MLTTATTAAAISHTFLRRHVQRHHRSHPVQVRRPLRLACRDKHQRRLRLPCPRLLRHVIPRSLSLALAFSFISSRSFGRTCTLSPLLFTLSPLLILCHLCCRPRWPRCVVQPQQLARQGHRHRQRDARAAQHRRQQVRSRQRVQDRPYRLWTKHQHR
jgi:hypothetical protein